MWLHCIEDLSIVCKFIFQHLYPSNTYIFTSIFTSTYVYFILILKSISIFVIKWKKLTYCKKVGDMIFDVYIFQYVRTCFIVWRYIRIRYYHIHIYTFFVGVLSASSFFIFKTMIIKVSSLKSVEFLFGVALQHFPHLIHVYDKIYFHFLSWVWWSYGKNEKNYLPNI